jgi:hypothetical protein
MADALASGASVRKDVGVQVPPRAPLFGTLTYAVLSEDRFAWAFAEVTGN